ncbi:DUF2628 domain-containing protein [Pseudomonas sp. NBRC 100443]|uniref:DUF2628 domain-containing protein n=1 Tax=Pseudomonas sp. NBRC 100443 TaxID=1113665 RepID=UPI0024A077CE|nr:DUF2628 domain-containing protein [Pseudomonas sp. NBRC 100443]GLU40008.1 membrane protein [Pseudomonas sp. NBRC 100443]
MESIPQTQPSQGNLKPKWQERFAFYDQHGGPRSETYRQALRALPFGKRILINASILAFFFGPIYWFVLGLWKKNLVMLGIIFTIGILEGLFEVLTGIEIPLALDKGIGMGFAACYAVITNYAYYLKQVKGQQGWNPFEGQRML